MIGIVRPALSTSIVIAVLATALLQPATAEARTRYRPALHQTNTVTCDSWIEGSRTIRIAGAKMYGLEDRYRTAVRARARVYWSLDQSSWTLWFKTRWQTRVVGAGQSAVFWTRQRSITGAIPQALYVRVKYQFQWGTATRDDTFGRLLHNRALLADNYWTRVLRQNPWITDGEVLYANQSSAACVLAAR
jgi:hypothetical protein